MGTSFTGLRCTSDSRNFGIDVTPWDTASSAKFWALVATCPGLKKKTLVFHGFSFTSSLQIHNMEMEVQEKIGGDTNAYMKLNEIDATMCNCLKFTWGHEHKIRLNKIARNGSTFLFMDNNPGHVLHQTVPLQVSIPAKYLALEPARPYALHQRPGGRK